MKYYYKISTAETLNEMPKDAKKGDILEARPRPNNYSYLNYDPKSKNLRWVANAEEAAEFLYQEEVRKYNEGLAAFASGLLEYFLQPEVLLSLTSDQKITLMSLKTYYEEKGKFLDLELMAKAEPALFKKVQEGMAAGEIPLIPEMPLRPEEVEFEKAEDENPPEGSTGEPPKTPAK